MIMQARAIVAKYWDSDKYPVSATRIAEKNNIIVERNVPLVNCVASISFVDYRVKIQLAKADIHQENYCTARLLAYYFSGHLSVSSNVSYDIYANNLFKASSSDEKMSIKFAKELLMPNHERDKITAMEKYPDLMAAYFGIPEHALEVG